LRDCANVADGSVDHDARSPTALRNRQHDLAQKRPARVSAAIYDEDISRSDQVQGFMDDKIVARTGPHCECCADEDSGFVEGPNADRTRQTA
jgi:hypothetical protein